MVRIPDTTRTSRNVSEGPDSDIERFIRSRRRRWRAAEAAPCVNRWHGMAGRQRDDLIGIRKKRNSAADHERVSPLLTPSFRLS